MSETKLNAIAGLQAERRQARAAEQDPALPLVQAQEKALSQGLDRYLDNAGGPRALYRLPWYLVIGDEQAGKTSFIDCTDQRFTLTRIDQVQAQGRQTEALAYPVGWWVSDDAVLIDPPGAFIRQQPAAGSAADAPAESSPSCVPGAQARLWDHLLGWLLRNRSQRALNGVVLVVDLPALLHGTPEQRVALAHRLRTRLYEVSSHLGSRLPLYVVLSKFDLNAFTVADFRDLDHGVTVLEQLTGPAAPLQRLLHTVRDNTSLASPAVVEAPGEVGSLLPVTGKPEQQQAQAIQRAFAGLGAMLQVTGDKPSYYDETLGAVSAVLDYAKAVQDSPDRGKAALQAVHQRFSMTGQDPIGTLQRVATGLPEPINHQVRKLADQTAQVLNVEALRELERRWDAEVYSFFQQRLAGRYPFVVRAPDASLDDFEAFFGPKGRLQQFDDQYLKVFLKDNLEALQSGQHGHSLIRADVIEQLELAERIRETFFDQRGKLSVQFSIEPLGLSANQRTSLLDLDGQLISYTHGPSRITGIVWPNTMGQQVRSNLTLLRQNGNSSSLEYRGPWSMFRLLSRGSLNGRTATSVDLSFRTGDGVMRYRLNAEKAFNPITQQPFKGFRLPRGLLQPSPKVAQSGQPHEQPL